MRFDHTPLNRRTERTARRQTDPYRRERDASAGWREEYDHAHAPMPDGGVRELPGAPAPGDRVRDRENPDDRLLAVAIEQTAAREYRLDTLEGSPTVADLNPGYDPDAPVVEAVYAEELATMSVDCEESSLKIARLGVKRGVFKGYTFPADRLEPVSRGERA